MKTRVQNLSTLQMSNSIDFTPKKVAKNKSNPNLKKNKELLKKSKKVIKSKNRKKLTGKQSKKSFKKIWSKELQLLRKSSKSHRNEMSLQFLKKRLQANVVDMQNTSTKLEITTHMTIRLSISLTQTEPTTQSTKR